MSEEQVEPRISVNKLGEYLVASPKRRRRIIADQKHPKSFVVARYREASETMISFLERGATDDAIIYRAIDELTQKAVCTEFQEQDRDLNIEALESFLDMTDTINLDGLQCYRGELEPPRLSIAGVSVSVRPEVILTSRNRAGERVVGSLKIYLTKSYPLTNEAGAYIGTVLQQYASQYLKQFGIAEYHFFHTLDVFDMKIHTAPRSYRRRQSEIEAACEEIARAWVSA